MYRGVCMRLLGKEEKKMKKERESKKNPFVWFIYTTKGATWLACGKVGHLSHWY